MAKGGNSPSRMGWNSVKLLRASRNEDWLVIQLIAISAIVSRLLSHIRPKNAGQGIYRQQALQRG